MPRASDEEESPWGWAHDLEQQGFRRIGSKRSERLTISVLTAPTVAATGLLYANVSEQGQRIVGLSLATDLHGAHPGPLITRLSDPQLQLWEGELIQAFPLASVSELLDLHARTLDRLATLGVVPSGPLDDGQARAWLEADERREIELLRKTPIWHVHRRVRAHHRGRQTAFGPILENPRMRRRLAALSGIALHALPSPAATQDAAET